ncbi:sugar-binding transcriptional regulator [Bacillus tuaregi]|uniref:sugar-binding transcriptional regulator n=1 Tax=Bacillus tuaregi TaxID=1816695 RepID=UPI0008F84771|nr:sugar-binding transcriptional regulator [Bacillus tuaregi]
MDNDKERLSIAAARLYYQSDYSQQEICKSLGVSRPTVSRLLQYAKEQGYVRIEIIDPLENMNDISQQLKELYGLEKVLVAFSPLNEYEEITKHITRTAADYLDETVKEGDIIGVSWGKTMHMLASQLNQKRVQGVEVVQLKGGVSHSQTQTYAAETVNLFAKAYYTVARYLPLPVIFDKKEVKQMVEEDRHIQRIIEMGKQANFAIFTVGTVQNDALLFNLGYFSDQEKAELQQSAVGDICSRFFDKGGKICNKELNDRTVGIELEDLREKEKSILVAGGERKIKSIHAALIGKYANTLIVDQYTARALLEMKRK